MLSPDADELARSAALIALAMANMIGDATAMERDQSDLLDIFDITSKSKLVEHARTAVIQSDHFANLIMACKVELIPFGHIAIFQHHHPEHLALSDKDLKALSANGVGNFNAPAQKAANKVFAMFSERRLFNGHMFWPKTHPGEWHLFYFDQRDVDDHRNHWKGGSHIHLLNWVTHPRTNPNALLNELHCSNRPRLTGSLHVSYDRATRISADERRRGCER